jgi:hypothetical protein
MFFLWDRIDHLTTLHMRGRGASAESVKVGAQITFKSALSLMSHLIMCWNPAPETSPSASGAGADSDAVCHLGFRES